MRAGDLRHRMTLQTRSATIDDEGGQATTWSDLATVWADLEPSVGRELLAAQAMRIDQPITIMVRWRSELADPKAVAAMRALYGSRIFNIHSAINVDERNRTVLLIASEGLNDG